MAYILYYLNTIKGCYGTIDLLRFNVLILCFELKKTDKISDTIYERITESLEHPHFDELSFQNPILKQSLIDEHIRIQVVDYVYSGHQILEKILKHIEKRFDNLVDKMYLDSRVKITIPGTDPENHQLGPMYKECWKLVDRDNYEELYNAMYNYISSKIMELIEKFDNERIKFGDIFYQNASLTDYQLWSANIQNWDLPEGSKIPGSYQALDMKIQVPGVYGIVVNPRYGYDF